MDWFEELTGFKEQDYTTTQQQLDVVNGRLTSKHTAKTYGVGYLQIPTLGDLREQVSNIKYTKGTPTLRFLRGDAQSLHINVQTKDSVFQMASQCNLLEMTSYGVTPEDGVTRYEHDRTQGPACAIACGAATLYRNYLIPLAGSKGQTKDRQLNTLQTLHKVLQENIPRGDHAFWDMRNGYALCTAYGLAKIENYLSSLSEEQYQSLLSMVRIGLHIDAEVTQGYRTYRASHTLTQAICSALPVAYTSIPKEQWKSFATFILKANYEATLLAGIFNAIRTKNPTVYLTQLGGGAFGNDDAWIEAAVTCAIERCDYPLDIVLVYYSQPSDMLLRLKKKYPTT